MKGDRTARWAVFQEHDHKDGGTFWSLRSHNSGADEAEALRKSLENRQWPSKRYAVLDWSQAKFFSSLPAFLEEE